MLDGKGVPDMQPPVDRGNRIVNGDPATLIKLVLHGVHPPPPKGRQPYVTKMPTFEMLSDEDLAALLTYLRSSFGNRAGPVTAAQVAAQRAKR
jgi:mono/diheme cytochrome c family protein